MARKKSKKKTTRRRRRIGAMALNPSSTMMKVAAIALGYLVAATPIKTAVDKALVNVTDLEKKKSYEKMIYGGMTLGGAYFNFMDKSRASMIKTILAGLATGAGLKNSLTAFGIGRIGGYGQVPALGGYGQVPALGNRKGLTGYAPQSTLNGYSPQSTLSGRNVMGNTKTYAGASAGNGNGSDLVKDGGSSLMG